MATYIPNLNLGTEGEGKERGKRKRRKVKGIE